MRFIRFFFSLLFYISLLEFRSYLSNHHYRNEALKNILSRAIFNYQSPEPLINWIKIGFAAKSSPLSHPSASTFPSLSLTLTYNTLQREKENFSRAKDEARKLERLLYMSSSKSCAINVCNENYNLNVILSSSQTILYDRTNNITKL